MKKLGALFMGVAGAALSGSIVYKTEHDKVKRGEDLNAKNNAIISLYAKWMRLKQEKKSLAEYILENGYQSVAIYGMNYLGETLLKELENSGVQVEYAIDRNANHINSSIEVITLESELREVDAVIVTAFYFFDEIESVLLDIVDCPIISLEKLINEMSI